MTVTFDSLSNTHNGWTLIENSTAVCACGHAMMIPDWMEDMRPEDAVEELHLSHKESERQYWLKSHGYESIDTRWATCTFCGCLVGLIDDHRTVCP